MPEILNQEPSSQPASVLKTYREKPVDKNMHFYAVTIDRAPMDVFNFFRNFENLPLFMKDLTLVEVFSDKRSRWRVALKSGAKVEWDAEIINEIPGRSISWRSLEDSSVKTLGTVNFATAPAGLGTVVSLNMEYSIPGGKLTEFALLFTGETPEMLVLTNLKRLKALLETGEIPTTEGQPSGRDEESTVLKH
jgi:uncharacterized membrane protein